MPAKLVPMGIVLQRLDAVASQLPETYEYEGLSSYNDTPLDGICPVNLCLGVIHRDSSSFFCRVCGRFWSFCSSVRSLNRAAVSTHDLTFQRRCKSSLTALNSP